MKFTILYNFTKVTRDLARCKFSCFKYVAGQINKNIVFKPNLNTNLTVTPVSIKIFRKILNLGKYLEKINLCLVGMAQL